MPPRLQQRLISLTSSAGLGVVLGHRSYRYCHPGSGIHFAKANVGSNLTCLCPSWEHAQGCRAFAELVSTSPFTTELPAGLLPVSHGAANATQQLLSAAARRSWLCSAGDAQA